MYTSEDSALVLYRLAATSQLVYFSHWIVVGRFALEQVFKLELGLLQKDCIAGYNH